MRILVTGALGNLGSELARQLQIGQSGHDVTGVDIDTMDITDSTSVRATFAETQPELVIHCAAMTAVDYCARHPAEALEVNGYGTQTVALACQHYNASLCYISTNEVFDGRKARVCQEYDPTNPPNPYGFSKWVGEQMVRDLVRKHYIVRTSWIFAHGGRNFVQIMLKLARDGKPIRVVTNEVSSPTYNNDLATAIVKLIATEHYGIYHLCNSGHASRYGFARFVLDQAGYTETAIEPISLAEYPRASRPPEYAILSNVAAARLGITLRPWQEAVSEFISSTAVQDQ